MQNSTTNPEIKFPIISAERYQATVERAKKLIRDRIQKPEFEMFAEDEGAEHPRWLTICLMSLLAIVMAGAFVFSAGKQVAVVSMLIDALPGHYQRLSGAWAGLAIASTLLVSEFGSVLFMISAGVFGGNKAQIGRFLISPIAVLLSLFAIACASLALLCNVAVAALDTPDSVSVVSWFTSVLIPSIVLGLGVILEQVAMSKLKSRERQNANFSAALKSWQAAMGDPTLDAGYGRTLTPMLFEEVVRLKRDKELIVAVLLIHNLSLDDPRVQAELVRAEMRAHTSLDALTIDEPSLFVSEPLKRTDTLTASGQRPSLSPGVSETTDTPPAVRKAMDWLRDHPETANLSVRDVAVLAKMSAPTIQRARQVMK